MAKGWFKGLFDQPKAHEVPAVSENVQDLLARAVTLHSQGKIADAGAIYAQILSVQPDHFDALHLSGVIQYQCGHYADAASLIRKAIEANPGQSAPYSNLGLALQKLGRLQDALDSFDSALARSADFVDALFNRGNVNRDLGRFRAALDDYDRAIALNEHHPSAWSNRGLALRALERNEEALESYRRALVLNPGHVDARLNRGAVFCETNRHKEALADFDEVIAVEPKNAEAHNNRGAALGGLLRHEEAVSSYGLAVALKPSFAEALYNRGVALARLQRCEASLRDYDEALSAKPSYPEALNARGTALRDLGRNAEALASYDRALSLKPDFPEALDNRGSVLMSLGRHGEALLAHDRALTLRPEFPQALSNRATVLREIGEQAAAMEGYRAAVRADPNSLELRLKLLVACVPILATSEQEVALSRTKFEEELDLLFQWQSTNDTDGEQQAVGSIQPFHLAYQEVNNRRLLEGYGALCSTLMRKWARKSTDPAPSSVAGCAPEGDQRIRLGIVSAHVQNHSVWNAIVKGWVQKIDRRKFQIEIFHLGTHTDDQTRMAQSSCDHFESGVVGLSEWIRKISARQLQVLIYPEVGMDATTSRLANLRLAPMQIAAWGHPETTGLPTMDYYLSAESFETTESQECYSENLIPLDNLGCFYESENVANVQLPLGQLGIRAGSPVFVCPGTPFKYAPQHDSVLVEIAQRVESAQFVFFTFGPVPLLSTRLAQRLESSFQTANLEFSRFVKFIPWQDKPNFYAVLRQADVFLDTIGFSGFNTAMQAVECGLPIVTREGRFMRGKFASAILRRMGMADVIADSNDTYVATAVKLATNNAFNAQVRARMLAAKSILYQDESSIRALEDFLVDSVQRMPRERT